METFFEKKMTENFPNLEREAQRVPKKVNPKRPTPRHIIIKIPSIKDKERILKAAKEKQGVTYKGAPIMLAADFST